MATFNTMANEVARKLAGFSLRQDRQTHLTADLSYDGTEIHVGSTVNISSGVIQIDDELIYVDSFDRTNNILSVPPYGRGYNGTGKSTHNSGSRIIISPAFPMVDIKDAINDTILAVGNQLYATNAYTFSYSPAVSTYALPDDVDDVISISYQTTGPTKEWVPIKSYRIDKMANVETWNSSKTISLYTPVEPGRTVQVFYASLPSTLENPDDDFALVSGLPDSCKDVITIGAQWRLVSNIDPGLLTYGSAESDQQARAAGRSYGSGTNASKYLLALYQSRLSEEVQKLQQHHPIRVYYTR